MDYSPYVQITVDGRPFGTRGTINQLVGQGVFTRAAESLFDRSNSLDVAQGREGVAPMSPAPPYSRGGSQLGNALGRIPILGYVLGPVGDIASGVGNLFQGNFGTGFSQISFGVGDFVSTTVRDAVGFGVGMTYGKMQALAYSIGRGDIREILVSLIIPHHDSMLGANWGYDPGRPQDNTSFMGNSRLEYASRTHDYNSYYAEAMGISYGPYHAQWIRDAWTGPGSEPGVFGQAIRLIGTPSFFIFSKVD